MSHLLRPSRLAGLALLTLAASLTAVLAGCDGNGPDERRPAVRSFVVDFDLDEATFDGAFASATFDAPEITPGVARGNGNGLVMAYVREAGTWTALPYTYGVEFPEDQAVDYTVTLGYAYETGLVEVFYELSADDDFVWDRLAQQQDEDGRRIKVVVFSEEAARRNQNLNFYDYEAVQQRFGLDS